MFRQIKFQTLLQTALVLTVIVSTKASAIFVDGKGHYSLIGETRKNPGFSAETGEFAAILQNFQLEAEVRSSDKLSFFLEFGIFPDKRSAYLGDKSIAEDCNATTTSGGTTTVSNSGNASDCSNRLTPSGEPRYESLTPRIQKAYAQYAFEKCLLTAGRRGRDWGLGIFLNDGRGPFDTDSSVFDGVSCNLNIQKSQTLGMSFGYDKITETAYGNIEETIATPPTGTGATSKSDDLDQIYFTIEYNDRNSGTGSSLTQQIGIYFANIVSSAPASTTSTPIYIDTDIKFADLYLGFFSANWTLKSEFLFRLGRSADPNWARLGGSRSNGQLVTNRLQALASAGSFEYYLSRSGSIVGPESFRQGNASSHSVFVDYSYAPGDSDGYLTGLDNQNQTNRTNTAAEAVAFHRNYKPALILFNSHPAQDNMRVDGIYDPSRVMNASVMSAGYRYKSLQSGDIEVKIINASLAKTMPTELKANYASSSDKPVGYGGNALGTEIDVSWKMHFGKEVTVGVAGGYAMVGNAFQNDSSDSAADVSVIQTWANFNF